MVVKGVCLDIAGVLVDNGRLLPGAVDTLAALAARGIPYRLLTNTSRRPAQAILDELLQLGLPVSADQLFSAPRVVADAVRARGLRPYLLVHPDILGEFAGLDVSAPNAVVLCDAADGLDYRSLDAAFALLKSGAPLLAVGLNRYFQGRERLELDAGPFVRALEYAAGIEAEVIGKPGHAMFELAVASMDLQPQEVLMVGDDIEADILGAAAVGLPAVLVRSGKYRGGDEARLPPGAICVDAVVDILKVLA